MGGKLEERIGVLEQRLRELRMQRQRREARQHSLEIRQARREEVRRKVLVGAVVLARVEQGLLEEAVLRSWLDPAIVREEDRALLGLGARESAP